MSFSLPELAIKRPVTVTMLAITMLALGMIAWIRIPLEFLPDWEDKTIACTIPYPGATPEQIEQQIAIPVEGEFRTIHGLRSIRTISSGNGCYVSMTFDTGADITFATAEIRDRIERLKLTLPPEVDRFVLQRFSSRAFPVIAIGVFRGGDQEEFIQRVRKLLVPRIRRLDGIANVEMLTPIQEKDVLIEFDQDVLRSMGLSITGMIATLRDSSENVLVGELLDGEQQYFVRVEGEYRSLDELANRVIGPRALRLKDVATVRYRSRAEEVHVGLDGKGGAFLMVTKESEANAVDACHAVLAEFERVLATPAFENVSHRIFFDQSDMILGAQENLRDEGFYGCTMALLVLFAFLHRIRPTIIVALNIPTSLVVALVYMFFADMSLNLITMVSMIIAVGMLVDNAIVVVENIIRYRAMGYGAEESARRGASEVSLAILASTVTTWVVFIPMFYMETGEMSLIMAQLGLPLIVAMGGSLVIALTLVPLVMSRMKSAPQTPATLQPKKRGLIARLGRVRLVERTIDAYGHCLDLSLRWRLASLILLAGLVWLTMAVPMKKIAMGEAMKMDMREINIDVDLDQNYGPERTRELFAGLNTAIDSQRDELGIKNVMTFYSSGSGWLHVYLYTEDDGPIGENPPFTTREVMGILSERLPKRVPGAELKFGRAGGGKSGVQGVVSISLRGNDTRLLNEYADQFKHVMGAIEGLTDVSTDTERARQEIQIRIDEELAARVGVTPNTVANTVFAALRGAQLPYMKQDGREVPVWAQLREEDRRSKANLDNVAVSTTNQGLIPLNRLVGFTKANSPRSIQRLDGKNFVTVTAKANTKDLAAVRRDLLHAAAAFELPAGYSIDLSDRLEELGNNVYNFTTTLAMAIILIYLVMSALFESYLLPVSILTSVPMALGGGAWLLYLTDTQSNSLTLIGCVLMSGIIVNNGIVIADHINQTRKTMPKLRAAIVQAGKDRFRPVMMTALTTILGLVPLAMATTGGAASFAGLGRALIGGLSAGTVLTLFVVPLFYSLIEDFQQWLLNFFGGFALLRRRVPAKD